MLHLITGSNGAGKTLNTLKWVRERQLKENRPVAYNGRFEAVEGGELASWKKIEFKDWQQEPEGTIFLIDECHNDLPVRAASAAVPDYVKMLAEHRKFGYDFYLITQHPMNIDQFVRRLIGAPGWHRHLKRVFGGSNMVSVLQWDAVNVSCEKDGASKNAIVNTVKFPKEVFGWYESASLHTAKVRFPPKLWVLFGAIIFALVGFYMAFAYMLSLDESGETVKDEMQSVSSLNGSAPGSPVDQKGRPMTASEYLEHRTARIPDFPHTAPAYDEVTKPVTAPYPAACLQKGDECSCYSQQATLLTVSKKTCLAIVERGFFMDWQQPQHREPLSRMQ